ncbi:MAG: calcium-binding protein [Pseudomonadota bacterium]
MEITGYTAGELLFAHTGPDLVITFAGTNDRITIRHALDESLQDQVEQVKLGDGTEWSIDQIRADILANATTSGDDTITGFEADDTIEGGLGDDLLSGADGSDTYIFRAGDGIDRIHDQGFFDNDRVEIIGHTADETSVARAGVNGDDLILAFANGDRIKIENTLDGDFTDRVERVAFSDGTEWTTDQLADRFDGLGADVTHAGSVGADTLIGSGGDDVMVGGAGADMFVFDLGGSDDAIRDFAPEDRIDLRYTGIASFAEVTAASSQDGTDVVIALGNGTSVRLTGVSLADLAEDDFLF